MKRVNLKLKLLLMGVLTISTMMTSCKKEDSKTSAKPAKILIGTTVKNADGMSGTSYMQMVPDFSGSIDNSKAIQIAFSSSAAINSNDIFVFPSFGKDGDPKFYKYTYNGTTALGKPQYLNLPPNCGASNITVINDEKMYVPAYGVGKVFIINPKTMKLTGEIDLSQYAYGDNNPEPSNGIIRDGLYYLCLDQVNAKYMPYNDHRQADVVIIDPQTDKVQKKASENISKLSFPTRPMEYTKGMIFTDEHNDLYIACVGNFGFDPTYLNNGFVCIPAGETEFDASKSWDISKVNIEGTAYQIGDSTAYYRPASIFNCQYIGNGKMVAYVGIIELLDPKKPYTTRNSMAVIIDLINKKIKKIDGIPLTDGHSVCLAKHNNTIIIGAYGKDKAGFFSYNPETEEVKHEVTTAGNPTFFFSFK